ncbi:spore coat protein U domain-containing protein [Niveispirillum sp. KHB5.9]|uniref:spore coat protein U domain-containing protein n=1 Tax=Niveispirillum sp. KHB5.9 TaxID=3400269 RepID=UPI003A841B72
MRHMLVRAVAALLLSTTALMPAASLAQSNSGGVSLRGTMPMSCAIAVQDMNATWNLTSGESSKTVGSVTESCNAGNGYSISLASANGGKLKSGANEIAYTVDYDSSAGNLTSQMVVQRASAQFGKKSDLKVTVPISGQHVAGDYADTITVTIAAR